jgi:hypothetical protein
MSKSTETSVKRKRRPPRSVRPGHQPHLSGFDFGVQEFVAVVSDTSFIQDLNAAKIIGASYGMQHQRDVGTAPSFALVGRNGEYLTKALSKIQSWDLGVGTDGCRLDVIFLNAGGYLLGISPDPGALANRLLPGSYLATPVVMAATWIHKIDSRDQALVSLKEYVEGGRVRPFFFGGEVLPPGFALDRVSTRPVQPSILKFNARFSTEDLPADGMARAIVAAGVARTPSGRPAARPQQSSREIARQRSSVLQRYFPITAWRTIQFIDKAAIADVTQWQFVQAVCNLALSRDVCSKAHYAGIPPDKLFLRVNAALPSHIECAGLLPVVEPDLEEVRRQVLLDGAYLLRQTNASRIPQTVADLTNALRDRDLLE